MGVSPCDFFSSWVIVVLNGKKTRVAIAVLTQMLDHPQKKEEEKKKHNKQERLTQNYDKSTTSDTVITYICSPSNNIYITIELLINA